MKPRNTEKEKAFNNWRHNAVHLTFPNGNSLSTIWGTGTYSDNHDEWEKYNDDTNIYSTFMESDTVEIMILNAPEKLMKKIQKKYGFSGDNVKGYLTMTEWLDIVKMLSN